MKWAVLVARLLVGLPFFVFGLDHFVNFVPKPAPDFPENALKYVTVLVSSGYMDVVKVLEVLGGAILLSGRLVPFGITLVTPVAVNILLFEIFLLHGFGPGHVFVPLCVFLIYGYWPQFASVFAVRPKLGSGS
jgi:putative oxidoreductase